jgi:hypothetical protein
MPHKKINKTVLGSSASLKNDACSAQIYDRQSALPGAYQLESFYANCDMGGIEDIAFSQAGNVLNNGCGFTLGCNVDDDSRMRLGPIQTNQRLLVQLFPRPYLCIPGMGPGKAGGESVVDVESQLLSGLDCGSRKTCGVTETTIVPPRNKLCFNPQVLDHVIEHGIRGGADSRADVHQLNYKRRCTSATWTNKQRM